MQRNENKSFFSINSPLRDIASDIGNQYLRRPFPYQRTSEGVLDYSTIRKKEISTRELSREIHGYQNACRLAALIPHLVSFYKKHATAFSPVLQRQINELTEQDIKILQIVSLLRSTGRTFDGDSGSVYCQQGVIECAHYLRNLGLNSEQVSRFSNLVAECEETNKSMISLLACILCDAACIETLRDLYHKNFYIQYHAFYQQLRIPSSARGIVMDDFIRLASAHAAIIKRHQGFLFVGIKDRETNRLMPGWTAAIDSERDRSSTVQLTLENNPNCFDICMRDVNSALTITTPSSSYVTNVDLIKKEEKSEKKTDVKTGHDEKIFTFFYDRSLNGYKTTPRTPCNDMFRNIFNYIMNRR